MAFDPQDAGDPLRVSVLADDALSGLDTGSIEMRRRGGDSWQGLAAAREGNRLVGYVDDERFRSGAFEFRGHARDLAGNESSTDRRANGSRATIDLPARFATRSGRRGAEGPGRRGAPEGHALAAGAGPGGSQAQAHRQPEERGRPADRRSGAGGLERLAG